MGPIKRSWLAPFVAVSLAACGGAPAAAPSSAPASSAAAAKPASAAPASAAASASAKPAASGSAAAKPAGSTAAKPSGLVKLTASYSNISGSNMTIYVTKDGGYFEKNGLDVDLQFINGGSKNLGALVAKQVQVGFVGSEFASANAEGEDLVTVGTLTPSFPYKMEAAPDIKSVPDLKGKPVGVSSLGGAVDIATQLLLKKYNMTSKDIIPVPDNGSSFRMDALLSGATKAAMADPPGLVKLENNGFHVIADLAQEKIPTANTGIVAERAWIQANHDTMQKVVDSLIEGTARAKKDKAFAIATLKKYFKTDDDTGMDETYDFFINEIAPDYPVPAANQFTDTINILGQQSDKIKNYDVSKAIDTSFVKSAQDRNVAKNV